MAIKHSTTANPGDTVTSAGWNADHTGTAEPEAHALDGAAHTGKLGAAQFDDTAHGSRGSGLHSDSHGRQHSITSTSDHTSTATSGKILKANANGLPEDATNTDTDVADAVTKKHSQNTDTSIGSGCVAADHGTAATDMVVNVCYGTGDPPDASTTTEGAIFLKYTA